MNGEGANPRRLVRGRVRAGNRAGHCTHDGDGMKVEVCGVDRWCVSMFHYKQLLGGAGRSRS